MHSLTRRQQKQVAAYIYFKHRPMSVGTLFWYNRRIYAYILTGGIVSAALAYWLNDWVLITIVLVAYPTMLLRDAAYYRRSMSIWPVLQEVIAWDKLEQVAASPGIAA
jgi:hypothetical protein